MMIFSNKTFQSRSYFLLLVISAFFLTAGIVGSGCFGKDSPNNQDKGETAPPKTQVPTPSPSPSPTPDPVAVAKKAFREKVWPSFQHPRCVVCHNFTEQGAQIVKTNGIPHPSAPLDNPTGCIGCHSGPANSVPPSVGVVGFNGWRAAPAIHRWVTDDDPDRVRQQIIDFKGPGLFKHLLGEGIHADPFVQWCFFNAPDDSPDTTKPGAVPPNGLHSPKFPDDQLLDYMVFSAAVREWLCLEGKIPLAPGLKQADDVLDCTGF